MFENTLHGVANAYFKAFRGIKRKYFPSDITWRIRERNGHLYIECYGFTFDESKFTNSIRSWKISSLQSHRKEQPTLGCDCLLNKYIMKPYNKDQMRIRFLNNGQGFVWKHLRKSNWSDATANRTVSEKVNFHPQCILLELLAPPAGEKIYSFTTNVQGGNDKTR